MQTRLSTTIDPHSIGRVLQKESSLNGIRLKSAQIQCANHILSQILDTKILAHCFVGYCDTDKILIYTNSAAWATRLRYQQGDLLRGFRKHRDFQSLSKLGVKILPASSRTPSKPSQKLTMTKQVAQLISHTATTIDHPYLKKALSQLAKNASTS